MRKILPLILCLVMAAMIGCAPKGQPLPSGQQTENEASRRWHTFTERASASASNDTLSGSLRFGTAEETQRVTYLLWSGIPAGSSEKDRILRLDISAGIGALVGKMQFREGRMTLVVPSERRAYTGEASRENMRRILGLSLPFEVQELYDFLIGRFSSALDSPEPEGYEISEDGGIAYYGEKNGTDVALVLDQQGLPARWKDALGWTLDITCDAGGLPSKLSGRADSLSGQQRLILLVKERRPADPSASLELAIPAGFAVYSLDQ